MPNAWLKLCFAVGEGIDHVRGGGIRTPLAVG